MPRHFLRALALLACLAAPCAQYVAAQGRFDFDTTPGNLPKTVVPVRYVLLLDLDPARDDFTGRADIDIDARQPVQAVVLHAHDLVASRTEITQGGRTRSLQVGPGPIKQSWALAPADAMPIVPGRYTLRIDYRGNVNRSGVGLYRADYVAAGKPARTLATQLESIDARKVFPSFDEPAFRAVFELSVRAPRGLAQSANARREHRKCVSSRSCSSTLAALQKASSACSTRQSPGSTTTIACGRYWLTASDRTATNDSNRWAPIR